MRVIGVIKGDPADSVTIRDGSWGPKDGVGSVVNGVPWAFVGDVATFFLIRGPDDEVMEQVSCYGRVFHSGANPGPTGDSPTGRSPWAGVRQLLTPEHVKEIVLGQTHPAG